MVYYLKFCHQKYINVPKYDFWYLEFLPMEYQSSSLTNFRRYFSDFNKVNIFHIDLVRSKKNRIKQESKSDANSPCPDVHHSALRPSLNTWPLHSCLWSSGRPEQCLLSLLLSACDILELFWKRITNSTENVTWPYTTNRSILVSITLPGCIRLQYCLLSEPSSNVNQRKPINIIKTQATQRCSLCGRTRKPHSGHISKVKSQVNMTKNNCLGYFSPFLSTLSTRYFFHLCNVKKKSYHSKKKMLPIGPFSFE